MPVATETMSATRALASPVSQANACAIQPNTLTIWTHARAVSKQTIFTCILSKSDVHFFIHNKLIKKLICERSVRPARAHFNATRTPVWPVTVDCVNATLHSSTTTQPVSNAVTFFSILSS
jgi:hypothetical protein